jgi:rusticyanin
LALARKLTRTAVVNRQAKTVTYTSARVEFVALGSPAGNPDETWNIAGLVNPTVVIRRGAQVTVDFFNADADQKTMHGWRLSATRPPYPRHVLPVATLAFPGAVAMAIKGETAHKWLAETVHFQASRAGTYYYICQIPGHAQKGMYGKLVVK